METKEEVLFENPDFEERFRSLISLDGIRYFYHITPANPEDICEDGLYLLENRLSSTTIEIPEEFIKDPIEYALECRGEGYRKNASIIILGIPEEAVKCAIEKSDKIPTNWNDFEKPEYVIPSHFIIGFIDTNNFEIVLNDKYELIDEYDFLSY